MIKRCNLFIAVLSIAATLAFTLFAAAVTLKPTFAAETSDFYMEHGAYVYINPEETDAENNALSGVKFRAYVPNTEDTYGMLIVPVDYFAKANIVRGTSVNYVQAFADAYEEEKIAYPATVYTGLEVKTANGKNYVEYSIADIKANNYDRNWFGIAFKVTGEEGSEVYTYAKEDDNVRSIQYVISCCLGELEFNADNLSEEDKSVYNSYKDVFGSIVSTSISNVVKENETVTYEINSLSEEYVKVGEKAQLSVNLTQGVNLKTFWSVDDTSIATIDGNGAITAIASGSVTVTAKAVSGKGTYLSDSITVKVKSEADIKFESMTGDELDKKVVAYASDYQPLVYSAAIDNTEKYGEDSTSSMKFTFTQPSSTVYELANTLRGTMFLDDSNILYNACDGSKIDWSKAYIGFYIKSSVACNDVIFKFATRSGTDWKGCTNFNFTTYWVGKLGGSNAEWKYLEMSLSDAAKDPRTGAVEFEYYTTNVTGFKFSICTEVSVGTGNTATFWIDGLSLYNKAPSDEFDLRAVTEARGNDKGNYTCEINRDSAYVKEGDSSLKYVFTYKENIGTRGIPFCYTGNFSNDLLGMTANMFSSEIYVGFWFKQAAVYTNNIALNIGTYNNNGSSWQGLSSGFRYPGQTIAMNTTEWQYIEVKLSDYLRANSAEIYTSNVKQYQIYISTEINGSTNATFYIDGFTVSNETYADKVYKTLTGDELDKKIVAYTNEQPLVWSASIDKTVKYSDDSTSSMKFTFTKPQTNVYSNGANGQGTNKNVTINRSIMLLDDSNILYNACDGGNIDWSKAYIGFWVKSTVNCNDFVLKFATEKNGVYTGTDNFSFTTYSQDKISTNSEWKYIELSLSDVASKQGISYQTEGVTGFKFSFAMEQSLANAGDIMTFWIDGLSLYNDSKLAE